MCYVRLYNYNWIKVNKCLFLVSGLIACGQTYQTPLEDTLLTTPFSRGWELWLLRWLEEENSLKMYWA